ncbi:hypothetical protein, partial [uncultured Roseovarius sp.]|uniref:hypothetical protein n=1 Tax=uncultured Roseovarius sp. TaxID=293344 RepID=UPI002597B254
KSTVYIPKPSRNPKGQKWTTFTPPATTLCRRYRGRVLLRRSQKLADQAQADPEHTAKQLQDARDRYVFITPDNVNRAPR